MAEIAPPPPQQEAITEPPQASKFTDSYLRPWKVRLPWQAWFGSVGNLLQALTMSGTTAQRPATLLWIGRPYYDTTLGFEINLHSAGPPPVWHSGSGTIV